MKQGNNDDFDEKDSIWAKGCFSETMDPKTIKEKKKTIHMEHNEDMNYDCKECGEKISAHNRDWHDHMCDKCFNSKYHTDIYEEEMIKIKCTFCNKEIDCPESSKNSKIFICIDCVKLGKADKLSDEEILDSYIEISDDDLDSMFDMVMDKVEQMFPDLWKRHKDEMRDLSKKELAEQMFMAGAQSVFTIMRKLKNQSVFSDDEFGDYESENKNSELGEEGSEK